ncbi:MAG: 2-hydroxyacyl-CoA dehydratase family protein [Eubacteriales bacterium]|jgi:benzoyl-CoA reductase/2-hydroxyglutaryl-CoA dehydratase subunit BcrC/BadD/HgdB
MGAKDILCNLMEKETNKNPARARKLITTVYKGFGYYQKHFPEKRRAPSRQYLADEAMKVMLTAYEHPDATAFVSVFTPCELLQAFDISPVCAEMFSTFLNGAGCEKPYVDAAESAGVAETFCSYHKVLIGAAKTRVLPPLGYVINTSLACDANNLTFREIAHELGREQFYIDVPYAKNEYSVAYVAEQFRNLSDFLEKKTGKKLDLNKLKAITRRSAETIRIMQATIPYRRTRWVSGDLTCELYEALMMHTCLGSEAALKYSEMLLEDYQKAPADTGKRIVWMHSNPFWQKPVMDAFNYRPDMHIAATDMSYDVWQTSDPSDPFRFMAERLVYDPFNGPYEDRMNRTIEMARDVDADGVILFCHWGCKETCGASALMKKGIEAAGFPCLVLNGDGVDKHNTSDGQMSTRIGAFVEMLNG